MTYRINRYQWVAVFFFLLIVANFLVQFYANFTWMFMTLSAATITFRNSVDRNYCAMENKSGKCAVLWLALSSPITLPDISFTKVKWNAWRLLQLILLSADTWIENDWCNDSPMTLTWPPEPVLSPGYLLSHACTGRVCISIPVSSVSSVLQNLLAGSQDSEWPRTLNPGFIEP